MNIGIIVHSYTGNTLLVANKVKDAFISLGHSVNVERVVALNENPSMSTNIELKILPRIEEYDLLIFGAPVRGLSLSPVMKEYLNQLESLKGKKVGCFVTQFFPFTWMGGKQSIAQMKKLCESKNAIIFNSGIINWCNYNRSKKINEIVQKLIKL